MITIIPQQVQSGYLASQFVTVPTGAVTVILQAIMNAADITTPGNGIGLAILWTFDGGTPGHAASLTWESGPGGSLGNSAPALLMPIPAGAFGFSGQLVLPWPLDVGLQMDMLDAGGNSLVSSYLGGHGPTVEVPVYPGSTQQAAA